MTGHRHPAWKLLTKRLRWQDYDPTWLVDAARALGLDHPDIVNHPDLVDQLAGSTRAAWECEAYLVFIDAKARPAPFAENVILEGTIEGDLALDVLEDGSVSGAEFLDRL